MTFGNPFDQRKENPFENDFEVIKFSRMIPGRKGEDEIETEIILRKKPNLDEREAFDGIEKSTIGGVPISPDAAYSIWKEYTESAK